MGLDVNDQITLVASFRDMASSGMMNLEKRVMNIGAAYLSWHTAKAVIGEVLKAGIEAEEAMTHLRNAVERSGQSWNDLGGRLNAFATHMQEVTKFSDEAAREGLTRLTDYGFSAAEAMDALAVASDLAAGRGMDLMGAVDLIAKAHNGTAMALSRYIGKVQDGLSVQETFRAQMEKIRQMFGGAAQADLATYAGRVQELSNAWNDFLEAIFGAAEKEGGIGGKGILAGLSQALREIPALIGDWATAVKNWWEFLKTSLAGAAQVVKDFGRLLVDALSGNFGLAYADFQIFKQNIKTVGDDISAAFTKGSTSAGKFITDLNWATTNVALKAGTAAIPTEAKKAPRENPLFSKEDMERWKKELADVSEHFQTWAAGMREFRSKALWWKPVEDAELNKDIQTELDAQADQLLEASRARMNEMAAATSESLSRQTAKIQTAGGIWRKTWAEVGASFKKNFIDSAQAAFGNFSAGLADQIVAGRVRLGSLFSAMAQDFLRLFIQKILDSLASILVPGILKILTLFDVPANDRMAQRQGADWARHFTGGALPYLKGQDFAGQISGLQPAYAMGGYGTTGGSAGVTVNVYGSMTRDFIKREVAPAIADQTRYGATTIRIKPFMRTGRKDGSQF